MNRDLSTTRRLIRARAPSPALDRGQSAERLGQGGLRTRGWGKQSSAELPLVTVVTAVRNSGPELERTMRSVLEQSYENVEYIVVDGASEDSTLDVIRTYDEAIDYWVSEPDGGISDAFNKGIRLACGELVGILNAGDWYEPDAVAGVVAARDPEERFAVYHGDLAYHRHDGSFFFLARPDVSRIWRHMSVFHPTMFVEREVYDRIGLYSCDFRYAMDSEFVHRAVRAGVRFVYLARILSHMRLGGQSHRYFWRAFAEFRDSVILHGGSPVAAYWRYTGAVVKRYLLRYREGRWLKGVRDRLTGRSSPLLWP